MIFLFYSCLLGASFATRDVAVAAESVYSKAPFLSTIPQDLALNKSGRETCPRQYDEQCCTKIQPQEATYSIVLGMSALYCTEMF
jgi:hypothetical protein